MFPNSARQDQANITFVNITKDVVQSQWEFGDGSFSNDLSVTHTYLDSGYYDITLIVKDSNECTDTLRDLRRIRIDPFLKLFVPSSFTPDENGLNDFFSIQGELIFPIFKYYIYNRWGKLVYVGDWSESPGWNGKDRTSGSLVPAGVYACLIVYRDYKGKPASKVVTVTILY